MRVPLSWLSDFTPLAIDPRDESAVRELARVADSLGLVTEAIEPVRAAPPGVVVARVLAIDSIEGADRIRLVHADTGDEVLEIVCGATNFVEGDVVPLARVGVSLPGGMTIAERKMRGVTSKGMLCSGAELGLDDDARGLLILASPGAGERLPAGVELGVELTEYLGLSDDVVYDLSIEPNRPDCLSIAGIARDLAARLHLPFSIDEPHLVPFGTPAAELVGIEVLDPRLCGALVARVASGLVPVASPPLVARRLALAGMRSISAIVDATNYVMLELGQPTHAYDLGRLAAPGLRVRLARPGEHLVTLDGVDRTLRSSDGVTNGTEERGAADGLICDAADHPIGLAGVMGGASSEVSESTTQILLEVAHFDPIAVGRAAAHHGLRSEASQRFWRGTDPAGLSRAADRVLELVVAAAAAAGAPAPVIAPGTLEDREVPVAHRRVHLRPARLNAVLGTELSAGEIAAYLHPIGFHTRTVGEDLDVEVPTFRPDTEGEIDVIEEVARHHGYEQIAPSLRRSSRPGLLRRDQAERRLVRRVLVGLGCDECWTSSLEDPAVVASLGISTPPVRLENPVVAWESALRTHLLPGLLGVARHNRAHRNAALRIFEVGHVFAASSARTPIEHEQLGVLLCLDGDDARTTMHVLDRIAFALRLAPGALGIDQGTDEHELLAGLHPSRRALVRGGDHAVIGALGEVDPAVVERFELGERRIGFLVLDLGALAVVARAELKARPVSRFPSADLDLAFTLAEECPAAQLADALRAAGGELLESLRLLDVYRAASLGEGVRSLTYRLRFCALDHTLSESELAELRRAVIVAVEAALPARLRS